MLKRRWHIANLLAIGLDIRAVASASKTSTQTVGKIKRILEDGTGGLQIAIDYAKEKERKATVAFRNKNSIRGGSKFVKGWFK